MENYNIDFQYFMSSELIIKFMRIKLKNKSVINNDDSSPDYYSIILITDGKFKINCYEKSYGLSQGDIFIAKPFEKYKIIAMSENQTSHIIHIMFSAKLFESVESDIDFLRAFDDRAKGENNSYFSDELSSPDTSAEIIKQYNYYLSKNIAFCHYALLTGSLISQLDLAFDNRSLKNATDSSNEYAVKIFDYIASHFTSPLTAESITKKFSISKWYLDKITKRFYGHSFLNTLKIMRMWHARDLMTRNSFKMADIAKAVGYSDYSAFYRCYLGFFGISPTKDLKLYRETKKFYTRPENE